MSKTFRDWDVEQGWLLPPSVLDFVPPDHLAHFVRDTVRESLDLSAIMASYTEDRGYPPYHPTMMTALLLYAYCQGVYSSRRIAKGVNRHSTLTRDGRPRVITLCDVCDGFIMIFIRLARSRSDVGMARKMVN